MRVKNLVHSYAFYFKFNFQIRGRGKVANYFYTCSKYCKGSCFHEAKLFSIELAQNINQLIF